MNKLSHFLCAGVLAVFSSAAAADSLQILEGQADANAYIAALSKQAEWMQRAFNICNERELCRAPLQIQFRVSPTGKVSQCTIKKSDITHPETANLFCLVVRKTEFPSSQTDVLAQFDIEFKVYFSKGRQSCPADLGLRAAGSNYVQRCLNEILRVLDSVALSEQYQHGADPKSMAGNVLMQLEIAKSGKVSKAKVLDSSISSRDFRQIIVNTIEHIDFGAASSKEKVKIRFSVPFTAVETE